jgi:hypothetical protein
LPTGWETKEERVRPKAPSSVYMQKITRSYIVETTQNGGSKEAKEVRCGEALL